MRVWSVRQFTRPGFGVSVTGESVPGGTLRAVALWAWHLISQERKQLPPQQAPEQNSNWCYFAIFPLLEAMTGPALVPGIEEQTPHSTYYLWSSLPLCLPCICTNMFIWGPVSSFISDSLWAKRLGGRLEIWDDRDSLVFPICMPCVVKFLKRQFYLCVLMWKGL